MKKFLVRLGALPAIAALAIGAAPAGAVNLSVYVYTPYQIGTTDGVSLGLVALGSTDFNRLTVGGTYEAACMNYVMGRVTGQRTLSTSNILGGLSLATTVPEWVPGRVNMPGFDSLARGATVNCTFAWTARAIEGGVSVSFGGISTPLLGSEEASLGSTTSFIMRKPSLGDGGDRVGCIP